MEHPEECQDVDMPVFDFREASPSSDKENEAEMYITDFVKWGPLYRNPAPELAIPTEKSKSKSKKRKDKMAPDSLLSAKSSRRKKEQLSQMNFDAAVGRGMRLPPHMGMSREFPTAIEMPDTLAGLEAISNDWKSFEDWQIVMTAGTLQGVVQNPQQTLPCVTAISCELVSYVTSTVNAKYRQARDCQVRLRTLRMREEKDSSVDISAPPKKKKKTKAEENTPVDKSPFPVPKRAALSLQEDNGRARTQIYKDVFTAFRSQSYNPPIQRRDAAYRAGASAWSNAVFQDMNIVLDDPITPLGMLRRRQERNTVSKNFLNETAIRWAQTLGVTVDAHGQRADTQLLSPAQKSASILQQTLQAAGGLPRTPGTPTGSVLPAVLSTGPQTPLPSPQFIAMNPNTPARRPVQFPGTSSPSPAPPPSSPLPSIGSTSLTQFIGGNIGAGGAPTVKIAASGPNVNVVGAVATDGGSQSQSVVKSPAQLSQQRAQQMAMLRQIFALPPGQGTYGPQDIAKIKEFLSARGIQFSDTQLADLARAFANKTAGAVADGAGVATLHQAVQQPLALQIVGGGNQAGQVAAGVSVATPVSITSGPRPMTLNRVVRFPPGVQASGQPTTFSLNFVNQSQLQPQNTQTVRPPTQNQARRTATTLVSSKNGPVPQVLPQQGKPASSSGVPSPSGPVTILPGPPRSAGIPNMTVNAAQMQQLLTISPPGNHVVQTVQGTVQLRRNVHPGTVVIPMNVSQTPTPQPTQTLHVQAVQPQPVVDGKVTDVVVRDLNATPPAPSSGSLQEPN